MSDMDSRDTRVLSREKMPANIQRRRSLIRKETARRNLLDSIYTRHSNVRHSAPSCLMTERTKSDVKLPRVYSPDRLTKHGSNARGRSISTGKTSHYTTSPNSLLDAMDERGRTIYSGRNGNSVYFRQSAANNLSLPGIILEFNAESNMAARDVHVRMTESPEVCEDERALGAPYEDYLKQAKFNKFNPMKARHRPVTPGLLDSLNRLKLPSKTKTEQWLRTSQNASKSSQGHNYRTENIDNLNWIYSEDG
ncbi:hypothetical protein ACF0H5_009050 [Mactra antiquata]